MKSKIFCTISALFIFLSCSIVMAEQQITVCGTGDLQELLSTFAETSEQANPGMKVNVPDSIGSDGICIS